MAGTTPHPQISTSVSIVRETGAIIDSACTTIMLTEAHYDFKIKVVGSSGYDGKVAWLNYPFTFDPMLGTSNDTMTLRVYCGPLSTTIKEVWPAGTSQIQHVEHNDNNLASPTRYMLPNFGTEIPACFLTSLTVIDSSGGVADAAQLRLDYKDNTGLDNLMTESLMLQAPVLDGGRYYVVPTDITLE